MQFENMVITILKEMFVKWVLVISLASGIWCSAFTQSELKFDRLGKEQGLTSGSVQTILQDYQGFMWFGTRDGLFRYDGIITTAFKHDRYDSTSLGNNSIFVILEDHENVLWLGTAGGGLNRYDRQAENFRRLRHDPDNPNSLSADVVSALYEDESGAIWAGTWEGLNRLDRNRKTITRYVHDPNDPKSMNRNWVRSLCKDSSGWLWIGTEWGTSRLDPNREYFTHYYSDLDNPNTLSGNNINSIVNDQAGNIWLGGWGGINRFDFEQGHFIRYVNEGTISAMFVYPDGDIWFGSEKGIFRFDYKTNQLEKINRDKNEAYSLIGNSTNAFYLDQNNILWLGGGKGVHRLDKGQFRFKQIVRKSEIDNDLIYKRISAVYEDRAGDIWMSTTDGNNFNDPLRITKYERKSGLYNSRIPGLPQSEFRKGGAVNQIFQDQLGIFWFAMWNGLLRYDPVHKKSKYFYHDSDNPKSLSGNYVKVVHEDQNGTLWMGTSQEGSGGLNKFDREKEQFTRFDLFPKERRPKGYGPRSNGVTAISEDSTGRLWVSTQGGGIAAFDTDTDTFTSYKHDPDNLNSLSHGWVGVVHVDREGMVWAAPWYGGLNKLDPASGKVTAYGEKNGLIGSHIDNILSDDHGNIWVTTESKLARFNPIKEIFEIFDEKDGAINKWYFSNAEFMNKKGELFFAGENGVVYFHPDSILPNPHVPPVVITKFTRYNSGTAEKQAIVEAGMPVKKTVNLTYQDHTLSFEFAALNYRNPEKNQYAYMLEGFNDDWVYIGHKQDVTFTNLDPGRYRLRVKGSNNDGVWNEEGIALEINIAPPWWQTWWAYIAYFLLAFGILYGLRRYELNRQALRHDLNIKDIEASNLREVDRLKSRFFANISHEFRTPLTLIKGPVNQLLEGEYQGDTTEQYQMIIRNCNRLLRMVNQLLDISRLESGKIQLQATAQDIVALTRQLTMAFESLAGIRDILLQFTGPKTPVTVYLERQHYEKIIINLIFNALKFTPDNGKINVSVSASDENVAVVVKDSGIGITAENLPFVFDRFYQAEKSEKYSSGSGLGLALSKELVELHHGNIDVVSDIGEGTTFTVSLPLGKAHLTTAEIVTDNGHSTDIPDITEFQDSFHRLDKKAPGKSAKQRRLLVGKKSPIVLVVDDNADMRTHIRELLKTSYTIIEAVDGRDGIAKAAKYHPDIIISDVMMPGIDGFQFCDKIKTDQKTSHMPVILLTARASRESKLEGLETGADDYLTKPFDAEELSVRLKNLLVQRQRLWDRFRHDLSVQPKEITITSLDEKLLQQALMIVEKNIANTDFQIDDFCSEMGMSRSTLNRKLRALTGLSTNQFIRTLRLKRASQLLANKSATIVEIAYEVGFNNPSYFAECFRAQFGKSPSEYVES